VATICGVWILAALFAIPSALSKYSCKESTLGGETYYQYVAIFELLVSCVLPLCVITFSHIMTACHLVQMSSSMSEETQNPQVNALKNTAKVVLGLTAFFFISYVPYHTFITYVTSTADLKFHEVNLNKFTRHHDKTVEFTIIFLKCLLFINSCLNPVALCCMSTAFRRQFKRYLTCCCKRKSPPNELELTRRN
jgi:gastrin-releasing peptide receptor